MDKDEVIGEDVRLRRLTKLVAGTGVAALAALAVGLAGATYLAVERQKEAERTARVAVAANLPPTRSRCLSNFRNVACCWPRPR